MAPYDGFTRPSTIVLDKIEIWAQIHDFPEGYFPLIKSLAATIGEFVFAEPKSQDFEGNFFRVRVKINVRDPLRNAVSLVKNRKREIFRVKYERLPDWCAVCGHLGHLHKECGDGVHPPKALVFKDLRVAWFLGPGCGPGEGRAGRGTRTQGGHGNGRSGRGQGPVQTADERFIHEDGVDVDMEDADMNRKRGSFGDMPLLAAPGTTTSTQGDIPMPPDTSLEAVDRSWRDWEDDGDWIWEDGSANPRVATMTSSRVAAIVDDPSSMGIYITRWSAKLLREIANTVKEKNRDVISKSSFGDLLHISPLPPPPEELVDFIVMRIDTKKRLLKLSDHKKIQLTRDMVKKLFNVPSGSKPLEFGKRGKADFREIYLEGERAPIPTTVSVLSNADDDDEDTINRTWILLCLSLVLAPGTGNMVPLEYLHTLQDMSVVHEFEWDEHILLGAMKEVKKYQDKRNEGKLKFHIGGCLPMLPVIYMDHIDIPRGCIVDYTIDYSLPRACFVKELDFTAVIAVDTIEDGFGKRPFSSTSPYATTKFLSYIEQLAKLPNKASMSATEILDMVGVDGVQQPTEGATNKADGTTRNVHEPPPKNTEGGDDVCGSLEDWLHPLPTFDELEKKRDTNTGTVNASVTISSPQQPNQPNNLEQGNTSTAQSTVIASSMQQASQPDNTKSVDPGVVVGKTNADKKPHKSESENNIGDDRNNAKGEDICSRVNLIRRPGETTLEDGPSFGLFEPGSPDALLFQDVPQVESPPRSLAVDIESFMEIRARSPLFDNLFAATASPGPVYDVTPLATFPPISTGPAEACIDDTIEEAHVEVSSGQGHDQKHPTLKRVAPTESTATKLPKMKKKKIDAMDDAIYQSPSFIRIGGFDISFKHFSNGLKKRAHVNNESKLCVDPSSFNKNSCTKDLKRACEKNDIAKADQLFFTIVKEDHWAVVVLNLIHKQFNVFDSNIRDSDYVSILEKPCSNLDTTSLLNFRKYIAAKLFKHPQNTLSSEEELEKLLKKS
ncbi:hypothetical protein D1007_46111 [Hordeum vulgare]|nr:hypothetical protein D1007_46111 [Hordeum vulgare]